MAPKRKTSSASPSQSPIKIGNCDVTVEAKSFSCQLESNTLQISVNRKATIKISVREDLSGNCGNVACQCKDEERVEEGRMAKFGDGYMFALINLRDSDSQSKSCLQEVLDLYMRELPTMNYAANTGKQSMFLQRCVSNGKYSTLLLKHGSKENSDPSGEIIAAITYQIVPADTKYAEVPLAAVSAVHQHKGFGCLLYMELRRRLQSVGIHTIYCWADKESEGFWLKQGFTSIAEVDRKGKTRRLPIRADIRKALCYPGGSTLMVCHLNVETSNSPAESLKFCFPLKPHKNSSLAIDASVGPGLTEESYSAWKLQNQSISTPEGSHCKELITEGFSFESNILKVFPQNHNSGEQVPFEGGDCSKTITGVDLAKIRVDVDAGVKCSSHCTLGTKRVWEASLSSLKSKKVKGTHQVHSDSDFVIDLECESDRFDPYYNGCSLGISKGSSIMEAARMDPLATNSMEDNLKGGMMDNISETQVNKEIESKGDSFRIMLMNIADDTKKRHLTKVIERLGGSVTPEGSASTHVVTGKVRATLNFCTALCSGSWVVSSTWLKESVRNGKFVDELPYVLCDEDYVLKYGFELKDAVLRARARPQTLLKGYNICIASHVRPHVKTLSAIVISAGGNVISRLNEVLEASKTIFIACEEDIEEALSAAKKGIRTFSSDWLMNCIMRQELDLEAQQFAESL